MMLYDMTGIKIRSRQCEYDEEEKGSIYHYNKESKRSASNNLAKLRFINERGVEDINYKCQPPASQNCTMTITVNFVLDKLHFSKVRADNYGVFVICFSNITHPSVSADIFFILQIVIKM